MITSESLSLVCVFAPAQHIEPNAESQENDAYTVSLLHMNDANRLTDVNGVTYTWDNNGNLLNDGINAYTYNAANQLQTMTGPSVAASYAYNGLGDRLQEIANGQTTTFTMDYNAGLTQALSDGTNNYTYGDDLRETSRQA